MGTARIWAIRKGYAMQLRALSKLLMKNLAHKKDDNDYRSKYLLSIGVDWTISLTPLISIVIASLPQSSSEELLALHQAGVLDLIPVGTDSHVEAEVEGGATNHYTDEAGKELLVYFNT